MLRTVRLLLLLVAASALWAPAALAADPPPYRPALPYAHTTAHFVVHYSSDPVTEAAITQSQARDLGARAEAAYALAASWGFPAPLDDGDGLIDIYVVDLSTTGGGIAYSIADGVGLTSSGSIDISPAYLTSTATVAHELFHLIQFGIWLPDDLWILEATAEWAGAKAESFPASLVSTIPFEMSLDCVDPLYDLGHTHCATSAYDNGGYSRWPFFQFLAERFGASIVKEIFLAGAATGSSATPPATAVQTALAARGATFVDVFNDWTVANMNGGYATSALKALKPEPYATVSTGASSGTVAPVVVTVDHLAARYVAFTRGTGSLAGLCHPASLTITVSLPAGVSARPYFSWAGESAVPLAVSGTKATATVPWNTCTTSETGLLSLPNPSLGVDGASFTVGGSIAVDKTRIASATSPKPGTYTGPTVPAPLAEEPPTIALYGPETLRVSKKSRVVRLVVFASGGGRLDVRLGSLSLGRRTLRAGNNDVRFTLPATALRTLASTRVLRVTSESTDGTRGETVSRKLVFTK